MPYRFLGEMLYPAYELGKAFGSICKTLVLRLAIVAEQAGFKVKLCDIDANPGCGCNDVRECVPSTQPCSFGMLTCKATPKILFEVEDTADRSRNLRNEIKSPGRLQARSGQRNLDVFLSKNVIV